MMQRLLLALMLVLMAACSSTDKKPQEVLDRLYVGFRKHFITEEGRVRRPSDNDNTVSEGQAYAMLIAVAMDDQGTFDQCFHWAEKNLSRAERFGDHLLAWKWEEGKVKDWNPASDADMDYAYALVQAYKRWGETRYKEKAAEVATDILVHETILSPFGHLLLPGLWGMEGVAIVQNPSYFSPAWYRVFADVLDDPRWLDLIEPGYGMIKQLQTQGVGLVPDWCLLTASGSYVLPSKLSKGYWWDAFRVPWRLYLDGQVNQDSRAKNSLRAFHEFYAKEWTRLGYIAERYAFEGAPETTLENPVSYVPVMLAAYGQNDPLWRKAYHKLLKDLDPKNGEYLVSPEEYYLNSWALLGLLALTDQLSF